MSNLANSISKFLRGDPKPPSASSKPTGAKPKTKLASRALHTSTPETSLESFSTLESNQESDTHHASVEEINSGSENRQRPVSQDSLDNGQSLDDRLTEIRSSIAYLRSIRAQSDYQLLAPPLHADLVGKIHKLSEFITLQNLSSTFHPEILRHMNTAAEIRATFSERPSSVIRRRSHSEGDHEPSSHPSPQAHGTIPQITQPTPCQMAATIPHPDVFEPEPHPVVAQPKGSSSGLSDQYIRDHSFSENDHLQEVINRLTERIVEAELKFESGGEKIQQTVDRLAANYDTLIRNGNKVQSKVLTNTKDLASLQKYNKIQLQNDIKALRDRCHNLEAMPAPSECISLRAEVNKLRAEVAGITNAQDVALNSKLGNVIANSLATFKSCHIDPVVERVSTLELSSSSLISVTNRMREKLASLKSLSLSTTALPQTPHQGVGNTNIPSKPSGSSLHYSAQETSSSSGTLSYVKKELFHKLSKIEKIVADSDEWRSDFEMVKYMYATTRPHLQKLSDQAYNLFSQISKSVEMDDQCYDSFQSTSEKAEAWIKDLNSLHHEVTVASSGQTANIPNPTVPISAFSGNSAQNVYEFLSSFEAAYLHVGNNKQRGLRLYQHYLTESVRLHCLPQSESYTDLRAWLIFKYGNVTVILNQMLGTLESTPKPNNSDISARLAYFSKWTHFFFRTDQLAKVVSVDSAKVTQYLCEATTFDKLLRALPENDETAVFTIFRAQGIDAEQPQGSKALSALRSFIGDRVIDLQRSINRREPKAPASSGKSKAVTINQALVQDMSSTPAASVNATQTAARTPPQWWKNGLSFPCPLASHEHELSSCTEFWSMTPTQRRKDALSNSRKLCFSCLKPWSLCKKRCVQDVRVTDVIKCADCSDAAKGKDYPPMSVLYCYNPDHQAKRPKAAELFRDLKRYLKTMDASIDENTIVFSNFSFVSSGSLHNTPPALNQRPSKSKMVDLTKAVNIFESSTGDKMGVEDQTAFVPLQDACLILQIVKIGNTQCLLMFDRGANVNLIDGEMAEREDLCVFSQEPTMINVAGGDKISSEYGRDLLTLGSQESGWHNLMCHGMPEVTVRFPRYNLQAINQEYRQFCGDTCPLPAFTGGQPVSLLIGLQNVLLDPIRIGVLPSGVGVFQSPFKDIFGSNICYGGPHQVFTEANKANLFNTSAVSLFLTSCKMVSDEIQHNPRLFDPKHQTLNNDGDQAGCSAFIPCVFKAVLPHSKLREISDQDDFADTINYRCPDCSECQNCKKSSKNQAVSLQDAREQLAIEQSVEVRLDTKEVWVDLPFTVDPVKFLSKRHNGSDNYRQALRVYQGQCRKPDHVKEGIRKTHQDLVSQGFIQRLCDLPPDIQQIIHDAPFQHYFPFRSVCKDDSLSTPVRLVVDPTMTGLNLCLPKGENRIAKIFDILIHGRCHHLLWSTDIGKMYNRLKVKPSSLAYQLLLFDESLDTNTPPQIWVLVSAWYGVVNTGNQASAAIEALIDLFKDDFPNAVEPLLKLRYVDDVAPGANSEEERDAQISDVANVLAKGGFPLKYVIKSGKPPPEGAALGEGFTKLLGYTFFTEADLISTSKQYAAAKLNNEAVKSRRAVASKVAELFDPIGIVEPVRLQLKIFLAELKGFEWDETLSLETQKKWTERLSLLSLPNNVQVPRFVGLPESSDTEHMRLICLSDAGKLAGGVAIYAGFRQPSGNFSCQLLTAKSRLLDATVPRNELSAIMHMTDLALKVKRVLGPKVKEVVYATDSTIALAWCHNTTLKLRLFVYNRVEAIRRMVQWTLEDNSLPIFHISGEFNLADWVTKIKPLALDDINSESPWQKGLPWMLLPTNQLPVTPFSKIKISEENSRDVSQECHNEPYFLAPENNAHPILAELFPPRESEDTAASCHTISGDPIGRKPFFIDIISLGWFRARRLLACLLKALRTWKHNALHKSNLAQCLKCKGVLDQELHVTELEVDAILFSHESAMIRKIIPNKKLDRFYLDQGIFYYRGRFDENNIFSRADLDGVEFLDAPECLGRKPVVLADSEIFFAYLVAVHMIITPHSGNAATTRQIARRMFVPSNAQRMIQKLRNDCSKCQIILKKTVEVEMKKHHFARTMLAPVFYNSMIDIAYGFPGQAYLNARKRIEIYALVIVCILSGATEILALEGLETQNVVQALERHSARHGVPAHIFIDNGTQLKALKTANFKLQDVHTHVFESMGMKISVSNAKAHEERGRVERRIGIVRRTLEKLLVGMGPPPAQTAMQWETLFAKIANSIDNLPLAKGNSDTQSHFGFEILTANRLKLGRNNFRSLAGEGIHVDMPDNISRLLDRNRKLYHNWYQLFIDEIQDLNLRPPKWCKTTRQPVVGDILIFIMDDSAYHKNNCQWKLGKAISVSKDSITIEYYVNNQKASNLKPRTIVRNPRDTAILFSLNELYPNSREYFLAKSPNSPKTV